MVESAVIHNGLDGVVVAETSTSEVDGARGRLIIKGRDVEELAFAATFEEVCALLWNYEGKDLQKKFAEARVEAFKLLKDNQTMIEQKKPMDAVRTATSFLTGNTESDPDAFAKIAAAIGVFAANWSRVHGGKKIVEPDTSLSHAADILRTIRDQAPSKEETAALDTYLTTVSDHGMNASTFTARCVASTMSDNVSCIVAAIGALKGPLHGGAPGPVLEMLHAIGAPENAEKWINQELDGGKRIMGMGHRIYKVRDPRAAVFEQAITRLEEAGVAAPSLPLARAVEKSAEKILAERHPDRALKANVEFYTAVLLDVIKIPNNLFSSMFAVGRVGGWLAHVAEQRANGRLIRPGSRYIGSYPKA